MGWWREFGLVVRIWVGGGGLVVGGGEVCGGKQSQATYNGHTLTTIVVPSR